MNNKEMQERMFTTFAADFGLKPEWLGKKIIHRDQTYTVVGLNTRSKRFPVLTDRGTSFSADYTAALITNTLDEYGKKNIETHKKKTAKMLKDARENFAERVKYLNHPTTWLKLDQTFNYKRRGARRLPAQLFTVVGYREGRTQYPIVAQTTTDEISYFNPDFLKQLLASKAA